MILALIGHCIRRIVKAHCPDSFGKQRPSGCDDVCTHAPNRHLEPALRPVYPGIVAGLGGDDHCGQPIPFKVPVMALSIATVR